MITVVPYAGTSGWSGSETSRDRAHKDDATGRTSERQSAVMSLLHKKGLRGITVGELRERYGWHHGTASGALSVLHKSGQINRLSAVRKGCKVYVLPDFSDGRETEPHASHVVKHCPHCGENLD